MKVVIFGAGASFDSINKVYDVGARGVRWRPPLGNDIFGSRDQFRSVIKYYPGAISLGNEINSVNDIEEHFQGKFDFLDKTNDPITLAHIINCQYYFSDLFSKISANYSDEIGVSNYDLLIKKAHEYSLLSKEEVCLITFNYDLLLERELQRLYCPKENSFDLDMYIKYPIKLFKPHGSCNWFRRIKPNLVRGGVNPSVSLWEDQISPDQLRANLESEFYLDDIALTSQRPDSIPYFWGKDYSYLPQLLIPVRTKDGLIMPHKHLKEMERCLKSATEILIVGWKGQEQHFNSILKSSIGNRAVKFETVSMNDSNLDSFLRSDFPNSTISNFDLRYIVTERQRDDSSKIVLRHEEGTFSSYMLNWYNPKGNSDRNHFSHKYFFES